MLGDWLFLRSPHISGWGGEVSILMRGIPTRSSPLGSAEWDSLEP